MLRILRVALFGIALWYHRLAMAVEPSEIPVFPLSDGRLMPSIGLGVFRAAPGQETYQSVRWALEVGYRLIDTAASYGNEADVGRAIADSGIPREQLFITTKLDTESHGFQRASGATVVSLNKLGIDAIDLLLIHSPYGAKIVETWDAMLQLQREGKVRSIGVSNFGVKHLEAIREHGRPMPAVNQIELHPLNYQQRKELIKYCDQQKITITAYGSLFGGDKLRRYADDPAFQLPAQKYKKTVPQILLRWALDSRIAVIPKSSSSKERLEENVSILDFHLTPEEVQAISVMQGEPLGEYWDPVVDAGVDIGDLSYSERMREEL